MCPRNRERKKNNNNKVNFELWSDKKYEENRRLKNANFYRTFYRILHISSTKTSEKPMRIFG